MDNKRQMDGISERERCADIDKMYSFRRGRLCVINLVSLYSKVIDVVQKRDGWVGGLHLT